MASITEPDISQSRGIVLLRAASRKPEYMASLVIALVFALVFPRLWVGDLLNSYPFMSDDSFDWVTQGVALVEFISGEDQSQWPILRPPLFVFVHAADHWLGTDGIVFLFVQVSALTGLSFSVARFARVRGGGFAASFLAGLGAPLSIVGVYAVWILSDALASSLMTISCVLALNQLREPPPDSLSDGLRRLTPAALIGALAGITQTYGMIPMLIIGCFFGGRYLLSRRTISVWATPLLAALITGLLGFGLQKLWAGIIPHGMQPETFGLLKPSLGMLPFYANVWPLTFGLFVPVLLWAIVGFLLGRRVPSVEALALLATVGAFALLSFCYQWPESRMTYIYFPLFILMVLALRLDPTCQHGPAAATRNKGALAATSGAVILATFTIVPGDYWRPSIAGMRFAPAETWLLSTFAAEPIDRYRLRIVCSGMDDVCGRAIVVPQSSPYRDMMLTEYKRRRTTGRAE